jgi:hypothetical protein
LDPKLKKLLERVAHILETGGGGYERKAPSRPDVPQEQRSIGPAQRGNLPVSKHALAALPRKRTTRADKIIGALSDFTPVAGAESAREGIHELLAGNRLGGAIALATAALDLAPGGKTERKAATTVFEHYSPKAGLKSLDPKFMGTGLAGAERARPHRLPTTHVYRAGTKPEPQFANLHKYEVRVAGDVYDLGKDPAGLLPALQKKVTSGRLTRAAGDELEHMIKAKGFAGYHNADYPNTIKLFDAHPMTPAAARRAVADSVASTATRAAGHPDVQAVLKQMQASSGARNLPRISAIDTARAKLMAKAYESLPVNDPKAKASYDALNKHVAAQKKMLEDAGFRFEFVDADPYKSSKEMMDDVAKTRTLKVYKTAADQQHPYMTAEQNNDFRAVHDLLAHAGEAHQFGPKGEENAFRVHASSLPPETHAALAAETRGQNSWVNFGPNAHLPVSERPFAQQKAALFPAHLLGDYDEMVEAAGDSTSAAAADWALKHAPAAAAKFKTTAKEIRAFPEQRRQDMIDALRGEAYMRPKPYGPAVITRDRWKPTSRGVFDRTPGSELVREPAPLPFTAKAKPKSTGLHPAAERIANDPAVEKRIMSDVEKGRDQGGIGWYGLAPLRDAVEREGGNFREFNMAGAAGSARTPTHNELTNMSINLFGRRHGLDAEGARAAFLERFPNSMRPTFMGMHRQIFDRGLERGVMGPNSPTDGALKIPHYFHNRMLGATGVPIDTHEQRMMSQATGIDMDEIKKAMAAGGNNYDAMTQPYHRVAEKLGMTADQVQASRWLGGGLQTGLKSQPKGDFLQTLEDGLLYTARVRGMGETPKELRSLFGKIVKGEDFFMPYSGDGGFPVSR